MFTKLETFLKGKKTYIVAFLLTLVALLDLLTGDVGLADFFASTDVRLLLEGLGLAALRAGVAK